jgi:leucyl aminopeptidase
MFSRVELSADGPIELEVLGCWQGGEMGAAEHPIVQAAANRSDFSGEIGETADAFPDGAPRVLIVGLGPREDYSLSAARQAAAAGCRRLAQIAPGRVSLRLPSSADAEISGRAWGEAAGLLAWSVDEFKGKPEEKPALALSAHSSEWRAPLEQGLMLAEAANFARTLVMTPPNIATPEWMAIQAERVAAEGGMDCRVLREAALEQRELVGLTTVGRASKFPPRLIRVEWRPEGDTRPPVVLLGKTITFDTGGYSIKGKNSMPGMKVDKAGGCAVLGAMHAVAHVIKPNFPVVGLLVAAENAIGEEAYRPDDVMRYPNGVTVEVTNTDAEGRLVLADGLIWAGKEEKAAIIVDLATLTGGVVTALGSACAGYFCDDEALRAELEAAAEASEELIWRLPILPAHEKMMKSPVADIVNSNLSGKAHPVQGAAFLKRFAPEDTPWAHIDIAGVASTDDDSGMMEPGPTGFGVRLLAEWLSRRTA